MPAIDPLQGRRLYQVAEPREPATRVPPHNIEAEQALLGALLLNNDAFDRVSDFLRPEHFSEELHRRIYEVCAQLIRAGKLATVITLKTFLSGMELPDGVTIQGYLARTRRRGHHNHQRRGLRPRDPRSRRAPRSHQHRRGSRQHGLRFADRTLRRAIRSRKPSASCTPSPRPDATTAASSVSPTR